MNAIAIASRRYETKFRGMDIRRTITGNVSCDHKHTRKGARSSSCAVF